MNQGLTEREKEILTAWWDNPALTHEEVGSMLCLTTRSFQQRLYGIADKMKVPTTPLCIAKAALRLGYLELP